MIEKNIYSREAGGNAKFKPLLNKDLSLPLRLTDQKL